MSGPPFNTLILLILCHGVELVHSLEEEILNRIGVFSKIRWQWGGYYENACLRDVSIFAKKWVGESRFHSAGIIDRGCYNRHYQRRRNTGGERLVWRVLPEGGDI
jgi:hypothetical protein